MTCEVLTASTCRKWTCVCQLVPGDGGAALRRAKTYARGLRPHHSQSSRTEPSD